MTVMTMTTARTPPELLLLLLLAAGAATAAANFTCIAQATCFAMAGYVPANDTTLAAVASLFTLTSNLSLVAANNLPTSTPPSHPFPANSTVRVPFPCRCSGAGTGVSDGRPIYRVREGDDGLDAIARVQFNGMVTFQEIAAASGIPDPNLITVGQELRIPLPCSCDEVDGVPTVHYAHMVALGSSVQEIATEFGTTEATLLRLNPSLRGDPRNLMARSFLDVPLRACPSNIRNNSLDRGLLVTNGSYSLTANNCVHCSCNSTNWELQCRPSQGVPISRWNTCPSTRCSAGSDVFIGNVTESTDCQRTICSYTGYTNNSILTQLIRESTCPSPAPSIQPPGTSTPTVQPPGTSPPANSTPPLGLQWWNWALVQLVLVYISLSW